MSDLLTRLAMALEPFSEMGDAMDDAEDLIDDEDRKEHAKVVFGGMHMGEWDRDDFRRAQEAFAAWRDATEKATT